MRQNLVWLLPLLGSCNNPLPPGNPSADLAAPGPPDSAVLPGTDGAAGGGPGSWVDEAPLPAPRQETAVAALGGLIYVVGGFDRAGRIVATVEAYDPVRQEWSTRAPLPEPIHHGNAAAVGGRLFILGALTGAGFRAVGAVYEYDPVMDRWAPRRAMPPGSERGAAMVGVLERRIYVAGGYRAGAVADFSVYDVDSDGWTALPPLPSPRDHGVGAAFGGLFYAVGGRGGAIAAHTGRVDAFDPQKGTWSPRTPMPTSRGGAAAGLLAGRIVVAGGEGNGAHPSGVFAAVEAYDPMLDRWTTHAPMGRPRHGTGGAVIGDHLLVPGGANVQAFGAVATVEAFRF